MMTLDKLIRGTMIEVQAASVLMFKAPSDSRGFLLSGPVQATDYSQMTCFRCTCMFFRVESAEGRI
jgi:hypothetical protein